MGDLLDTGNDVALLVTPIDASAPKGRLILPQQQTIRDILDAGAIGVVVADAAAADRAGSAGQRPRLVITDSQAFEAVKRHDAGGHPAHVVFHPLRPLQGRAWRRPCAGRRPLDRLRDGDTVLISEGCTHHRQCEDIGTVKLPGWLNRYTGRRLQYRFTSGGEFPEDLSPVSRWSVHCGGCMLNEREMQSRVASRPRTAGVPITNYGIAIAQMHGVLRRALSPFPGLAAQLETR